MTNKQIEAAIEAINRRLDAQSLYIINELMPSIVKVRGDIERLWVSNDRFTEVERAVADIAMAVRDDRAGKADRRVRPD